jgi:hypothetical protein
MRGDPLRICKDCHNDELAKDLAETVNNQQLIAAGVVPAGNILYKGGRHIVWTFDVPKEFALSPGG